MVEWILESWAGLPECLIKKSFKGCALNLAVDESDANLFHCFKGSQCEAGVELLKQQLLVRGNLSLKTDLFENADEDTEESLLLDLSDDEVDFVDIFV